jgi:hypothetical protein
MNFFKSHFARICVAFVLALGTVGVPSSAQAAHPCPRGVEFLGLHGLNEGAVGGFPEEEFWGKTINSVWLNLGPQFHSQVHATAVGYPKLIVSEKEPYHIPDIYPAAKNAAQVLQRHIIGLRGGNYCILIAGFSQGAWSVDMALRNLGRSSNPTERQSLRSIVGVFLMGDPAFPFDDSHPDRAGLATRAGLGYKSRAEYQDNDISKDKFASICLGLSNGQTDPVCMASEDARTWLRDKQVHYSYPDYGGTKIGADFLFDRAKKYGGAS